jgi:hypothetical protein
MTFDEIPQGHGALAVKAGGRAAGDNAVSFVCANCGYIFRFLP